MRMIGTVPDEDQAQRFTAYLLTQGIDAQAEPSETSGAWLVWVEHDDHLDRGRAELAAFVAAPNDPKYRAIQSQARQIRREQEKAIEKRRRNYQDVRTSWALRQQRLATPLTIGLVLACVAVFLFSQGDASRFHRLFDALAYEPPGMTNQQVEQWTTEDFLSWLQSRSANPWLAATESIRHGQIWRLFTPMLMHGGITHILFNMMWLLSLGGRLEARKGPWLFLAVVLIGGAIAHSAEAFWMTFRIVAVDGADAGAVIHINGLPFLGMSGVNYAVVGFVWIYGRLRPYDGLSLMPQDIGLALGWLVICLTGLVGNIANAAHVMGLVSGMVMAWAYVRYWPRRGAAS